MATEVGGVAVLIVRLDGDPVVEVLGVMVGSVDPGSPPIGLAVAVA